MFLQIITQIFTFIAIALEHHTKAVSLILIYMSTLLLGMDPNYMYFAATFQKMIKSFRRLKYQKDVVTIHFLLYLPTTNYMCNLLIRQVEMRVKEMR